MRVLVIEDEIHAAEQTRSWLEHDAHDVDVSLTTEDGQARAAAGDYDVIIIDRMFGADTDGGVRVVANLRKQGLTTPVLFLSNIVEVEAKVEGLNSGANDYMDKKCSEAELLARVKAVWNGRERDAQATRLQVADLEMDLLARTVRRNGRRIDLQPREFKLLEFLMRHAGTVVTRKMLLENVWEYHFDPQTNVIDVHISRLRGKIDREFDAPLLHTVRGAGYRLEG